MSSTEITESNKTSQRYLKKRSEKLCLAQRRKGRQEEKFSLRSWRLGAINFLEVVLLMVLRGDAMRFGVLVSVAYPGDFDPGHMYRHIYQQADVASKTNFEAVFAAHHYLMGPDSAALQPLSLLANPTSWTSHPCRRGHAKECVKST